MSRRRGSRTGDAMYRDQRARMLRKAAKEDAPCCFCGMPIDYQLKWPHRQSPSADHAVPVTKGGRNSGPSVVLRPAHLACNIGAGNRRGVQEEPPAPADSTVTVYGFKRGGEPTVP